MTDIWTGGRRIAFIPVWNQQVDQEPGPDWAAQVGARAFYDPDPATGFDRSLQNWIRAASSGRAHIDGAVLPVVAAADADTVGAGLNTLPAQHDFGYAVIVLPHSQGQHRGGFAWWDAAPVRGLTNFARVAMFSDAQMTNRNTLGVWAMEVLHAVTEFGDLYFTNPMPGAYDVMACACGTHPSAHTKSAIGWLHPGALREHALNTNGAYTLHALSLPQPPPPGRVSAISIRARGSTGHFIVEARLRTDPFEAGAAFSSGIPDEGVVVYEVQGPTEIYLRTPGGLQVGQTFADAGEFLSIKNVAARPGGFSVAVAAGGVSRCVELARSIDALEASLQVETDFFRRKQLISALQQARAEFRQRGCLLVHDPATEVFAARMFGPRAGRAVGDAGDDACPT